MRKHSDSEAAYAPITRRRFLQLGAAALGSTLAAGLASADEQAAAGLQEPLGAAMPTRALGRTGYQITLFSMGGEGMLDEPENRDRAVEMLTRAVELGVNYFDSACLYNASQDHLGEALEPHRDKVWIATKTHARDRDTAWRQLENSLRRLRTDHLDIWQMHMIHRLEEVDAILAPGGAVRAAEQAREQGLLRFIGVTGHYDPLALRAAIERYPFDTVLCPMNAADGHQHGFTRLVLPLALEKQMGIIGMKVFARDKFAELCGLRARECLYYAWSLPISAAVASIEEIQELEENVRLAREFKLLTSDEMFELQNRTYPHQVDCTFYHEWAGPANPEDGGWLNR